MYNSSYYKVGPIKHFWTSSMGGASAAVPASNSQKNLSHSGSKVASSASVLASAAASAAATGKCNLSSKTNVHLSLNNLKLENKSSTGISFLTPSSATTGTGLAFKNRLNTDISNRSYELKRQNMHMFASVHDTTHRQTPPSHMKNAASVTVVGSVPSHTNLHPQSSYRNCSFDFNYKNRSVHQSTESFYQQPQQLPSAPFQYQHQHQPTTTNVTQLSSMKPPQRPLSVHLNHEHMYTRNNLSNQNLATSANQINFASDYFSYGKHHYPHNRIQLVNCGANSYSNTNINRISQQNLNSWIDTSVAPMLSTHLAFTKKHSSRAFQVQPTKARSDSSSYDNTTNDEEQNTSSGTDDAQQMDETTQSSSSDNASDNYMNYNDAYLFNKMLKTRNYPEEKVYKLQRNRNCLSILIEGDLIEYVKQETDLEEKDYLRQWAIYMGNSMIMRFDETAKRIQYESYWKIAKYNYIFINRDLDKRLQTLPIYEILNKARFAYTNNRYYAKKFSSDKNFAMWCRFDINKSDIDFSTQQYPQDSTGSKTDFLINKFLSTLDQGEPVELDIKIKRKKSASVQQLLQQFNLHLQANSRHHHSHHHNHHHSHSQNHHKIHV